MEKSREQVLLTMLKPKTREKQQSRRLCPMNRSNCLKLLILGSCLLILFTALPQVESEFYMEVRGRVLDENGEPLQNATVAFWQVEEMRTQWPPNNVWTPSPYLKGFLETSTKTDADGLFNATLNGTTSWPYEYRLYIYTDDSRYVPFVRFLGQSPELPEDFSVQLTPAASYILDGDVLIVDSSMPWQSVSPLIFHIIPVLEGRVSTFCDPVDSYFGEAHSYFLGLEPRHVIVPANTSVDILVEAVTSYRTEAVYPQIRTIRELVPEISFFFRIEELPILEQGQSLHIDLRKYSVECNLLDVQDLLQEVERSFEKAQLAGFYISAEKQDLTEAKDLLTSAERKHMEELYGDSYVDVLQAYQIATQVSQRINAMYPEAVTSATFLPLFLVFTAVAVASLLSESQKSKVLLAAIVYVVLLALFYYLYPGSRLANVSILIGTSIAYIAVVSVLVIILPRLVKETAFNGRIGLGSAVVALFSLAKRNIRRRKLRFILSLATVTISVASFVALTSASIEYGLLVRRSSRSTPVEGLLVRSAYTLSSAYREFISFTPMRESDIAWLATRNGSALVAPRLDSFPARIVRFIDQHRTTETPYPLGDLVSSHSSKMIFSVVGVVPSAESSTSHLDSIVKTGRYLTDNDTNAILLSEKTAEKLGVQVGDELSWSPRRTTPWPIEGRTSSFKLVGIFEDSSLNNLMDLDGQPFLLTCQKQLEETRILNGAHTSRTLLRCLPEEVVITTCQSASSFSSSMLLSRVNVLMDNSSIILPFARELTITRNFRVWASVGDSLYFYEMGSFAEIGGSGIIIALIVVLLTVGTTISASVYERRHEIRILSAVGLNPSHITMLFVEQAVIIGLIGGAFGYLLGTSLYRIFVLFPTDIVVRQKLSLGWSLVALTIGIVVAALGAAVPAIKASIQATPSLLRQWKIERKPSSVGEPYVSEIPVKVQRENIDNFVNYVIRRLQEYEEGEPFRIKRIERTYERSTEESTTHIKFTYFFSLQIFSFLATNDIAVTIKKNEDVGTVQLSSKGAGSDEEKHIRRIASLVRNFIYEWTSQKTPRR